MVRNYVKKTTAKYNYEELQKARDRVENGDSIYKAAKEFNIPYETLRRWVVRTSGRVGSGRPEVLTVPEERLIVKPQRRRSSRLQEKKVKNAISKSSIKKDISSIGKKMVKIVPSSPKKSFPNPTSLCIPVNQNLFNIVVIPNVKQTVDAKTASRLTFNQLIPHITGMSSQRGPVNLVQSVVPLVTLAGNNAKPVFAKLPEQFVAPNPMLMQLLLPTPPSVTSSVISKQLSVKSEAVPSDEQRFQAQSQLLQSGSIGFPESICEQQLLEDSTHMTSFDVDHETSVLENEDSPDIASYIEASIKKDIVASVCEPLSKQCHSDPQNKRIPKCETCGKVFSTFAAVRRHQPMHSEERPFKCNVCSKSFRWENSWQVHMKRHKSQVDPMFAYTCKCCGERFGNRSDLDAHTKSKHIQPTTALTCDICNTCCEGESEFHLHRYKHIQDRLYCMYCRKSFDDKDTLQDHMRLHVEQQRETISETLPKDNARVKRFICSVCYQSFPTNSQLNQHAVKHTGVRPFTCEECGKTYRSKTTLAGHINNHRGIMPFSCQFCDRRFLFLANKQKHEKRHMGIRDFKCAFCNKSFYEKQELQRHVARHHATPNVTGHKESLLKCPSQPETLDDS